MNGLKSYLLVVVVAFAVFTLSEMYVSPMVAGQIPWPFSWVPGLGGFIDVAVGYSLAAFSVILVYLLCMRNRGKKHR
jgi:hypothetical protein